MSAASAALTGEPELARKSMERLRKLMPNLRVSNLRT
jgi:hypothetical protein